MRERKVGQDSRGEDPGEEELKGSEHKCNRLMSNFSCNNDNKKIGCLCWKYDWKSFLA